MKAIKSKIRVLRRPCGLIKALEDHAKSFQRFYKGPRGPLNALIEALSNDEVFNAARPPDEMTEAMKQHCCSIHEFV